MGVECILDHIDHYTVSKDSAMIQKAQVYTTILFVKMGNECQYHGPSWLYRYNYQSLEDVLPYSLGIALYVLTFNESMCIQQSYL